MMQQYIFLGIVIILSAIIHEFAHGWAADKMGDPTARYAGRLTLNPIPHIDPLGTIFVPLFLILSGSHFIFGWAKPVPYNPFNLKYKKWGGALVAIAGPSSNLLIALLLSIMIRLMGLSVFTTFLALIVYLNILLAVFNLVPVPPLDGSKILYALLPNTGPWFKLKVNLERYGMILVVLVIFLAWPVITPIIMWLFKLFVGFSLF